MLVFITSEYYFMTFWLKKIKTIKSNKNIGLSYNLTVKHSKIIFLLKGLKMSWLLHFKAFHYLHQRNNKEKISEMYIYIYIYIYIPTFKKIRTFWILKDKLFTKLHRLGLNSIIYKDMAILNISWSGQLI